ncbi:MAG: ATP-dependent DNA helicase RecG, partial [Lachnospiraceae bacterium]|nr:ATP-dependent DNA helicase RecG [Lachnospiraceae bacterium]
MRLDDHLESIKGIGEKTAAHFNKLGLFSVGSLLTYYPRRYDDFREPTDISALKEGETGVICACVSFVAQPKAASRIKIVTCKASDPSGEIELVWFNMPWLKKQLHAGQQYVFRGRVVRKRGRLTMEQPEVFAPRDYAHLA